MERERRRGWLRTSSVWWSLWLGGGAIAGAALGAAVLTAIRRDGRRKRQRRRYSRGGARRGGADRRHGHTNYAQAAAAPNQPVASEGAKERAPRSRGAAAAAEAGEDGGEREAALEAGADGEALRGHPHAAAEPPEVLALRGRALPCRRAPPLPSRLYFGNPREDGADEGPRSCTSPAAACRGGTSSGPGGEGSGQGGEGWGRGLRPAAGRGGLGAFFFPSEDALVDSQR